MVGSVLATAVRLWVRNLPRFFLLAIIAYLPIVAWNLVLAIPSVRGFVTEHVYMRLAKLHPAFLYDMPGAAWIPMGLFAAALAVCTVARLRDERVSIWRGLAVALRRAPSIIALAFVIVVATHGVMKLVQILLWDHDRLFPVQTTTALLGYAALWVVLAAVFVLAIPAAAVERRGVWASLARGWAVARGAHIKVLAIVLVHYVVVAAISYALFYVMVLEGPDPDRMMIFAYVRFGFEIVTSSLAPVLAAVTFEKLRAANEGPAPSQLHAVFD